MGSGEARAPFSEPREWKRCAYCRSGYWKRHDQVDRFAPCPKCGQPPRCLAGAKTEHPCPRPATDACDGLGPWLCGQHSRHWDLCREEEEWETAGRLVDKFRVLAEELCNWALLAAFDLAWAECEMRAEGARQERRMIWEVWEGEEQ